MKRILSKIFIAIGITMILMAISLTIYNIIEDRSAADAAERVVEQICDRMGIPADTERTEKEQSLVSDNGSKEALWNKEQPLYLQYPEMAMPAVTIDGYRYIGTLEIPALDLTLPVMEEWSYPGLRVAPGRYSGSAYTRDMVIAGHNYSHHFSPIKQLPVGSTVKFTDMSDNVFTYRVEWVEILKPEDTQILTEETEGNEWDLTLFTCTTGGGSRYTVRCVRTQY